MPTPSDIVLAVALLNAPPGTVDPIPSVERWPAVSAALIQTAERLELLDPGETRYRFEEDASFGYFSDRDRFRDDLESLRHRACELRDAPLVAEGAWLPDVDTAERCLGYWREREKSLRWWAAWYTHLAPQYDPHIEAASRAVLVYKAIRSAKVEGLYVSTRREYLATVKRLIGDEAWRLRKLPTII